MPDPGPVKPWCDTFPEWQGCECEKPGGHEGDMTRRGYGSTEPIKDGRPW